MELVEEFKRKYGREEEEARWQEIEEDRTTESC